MRAIFPFDGKRIAKRIPNGLKPDTMLFDIGAGLPLVSFEFKSQQAYTA
jgi:hypothetical protein